MNSASWLPAGSKPRDLLMGRRALPKLDPKLDITANFRSLEELPRPWDPHVLFAHDGPVELEVGSGKGLFLQNAAASCPQHNFLGIEVSRKYARFTAARLAKHGLRNAMAVHGDGLVLLREIIPDSSLQAVHVYFPDPWWKKRHHKRRVLTDPFLGDISRTLTVQGRFHFWTDVKDYYDATLELIKKHDKLAGPFEVSEKVAEHEMDFRSHFERRTRLNEEPVYRAEFIKE